MLVARYLIAGEEHYGVLEEAVLKELAGPPYHGLEFTGETRDRTGIKLLEPCRPGKILAVGLNYRDHAAELGHALPQEPVLFMKPTTTLLPPSGEIIYPRSSSHVDYEAELALVIGKTCREVPAEEAPGYIFGCCCANDVTARDLQVKDGQWTRARSFDTFCPLGPWMALGLDPSDLRVSLRLNGATRQSSSTSEMVFSPAELVSFISGIMTLEAGDVILTGTPPGVGKLTVGDEVEVEIEGIGILRNSVAAG